MEVTTSQAVPPAIFTPVRRRAQRYQGLIREWSSAGQAAATPAGVAGWGLTGGRSGGWLEGDGVAEGFELGDQPAGFPFGVQAAGEVVGAEFVVGLPGGQYVPDDDDQGVGHLDDGFLLRGLAAVAAPFHHVPVVERLEIPVLADRGPGALDQDGLQVRVALAALAGAALAG